MDPPKVVARKIGSGQFMPAELRRSRSCRPAPLPAGMPAWSPAPPRFRGRQMLLESEQTIDTGTRPDVPQLEGCGTDFDNASIMR